MTPIDVKKIRDDVKANLARWDGCVGPHQFTDATPDKPLFKRWRCSLCGGECDGIQKSAYEKGLAHGMAGIEKAIALGDEARAWIRHFTASERVLTCVYCGHAYPPGSPEHGAEVLTAHIRVCDKHPLSAAVHALLGIGGDEADDDLTDWDVATVYRELRRVRNAARAALRAIDESCGGGK